MFPSILSFLVLPLPVCMASAQYDQGTLSVLTDPGTRSTINGWHLRSSKNVSAISLELFSSEYDTSSWHRISSRATVFAALLQAGVYNESTLFYSNNLERMVGLSSFRVPWLYREAFHLDRRQGQHYFLHTHGITSRAQIHLNGQLVADETTQVGAHGGLKFDATNAVQQGTNALLITAYPTNYLRDFAMGFVDWNIYPPDNGTGAWRNVEMETTGPVSVSPPRIRTDFQYDWQTTVTVTTKVDIANHDNHTVNTSILLTLRSGDGSQELSNLQTVRLDPGERLTVSLPITLNNPQIWWPASWGSQPLYTANVAVSTAGKLSDKSSTRFGIRHTSSYLNSHNDTQFLINSHHFLVLGAGYTSDIFYRFNLSRLRTQFKHVLDMGLNTIRLEGKQEQPELYDLADEMGLMILAGWECCDKWEGWSYNDEAEGLKWSDADYETANKSMRHEAAMMQSHPSLLAFLVGSDFWPDNRATKIYVDALQALDWPNPVIASAAKRGYPKLLGPGGMKMDGPYDWVTPNYWYRKDGELGAAGGFGSELGSGVGTPEIGSLKKFLSPQDLEDLWTKPKKGLYHMSTNVPTFYTRELYNAGLFGRYGKPKSLEDYLLKAQMMDYEATRSQFESYAARKNAERPSTGLIHWMLSGGKLTLIHSVLSPQLL
jgi:exo-1,4-beta-D-glucosaminidase